MSQRTPFRATGPDGDLTLQRHARCPLVVRATITALAFGGFGLLAMACRSGGSDNGAVAPDTLRPIRTTIASAESTTAAPPPTTTSTTTTTATVPATSELLPATSTSVAVSDVPSATAAPAGECAGVELVPSAVAEAIAQIDGDWNGDGVQDVAVSWREPNGSGWLWFVRTEVTGGAGAAYALGDLGVGFARVLGRIDVDQAASAAGRRDEILAVAGASAAGYQLGVFGVGDDGCVFRFDNGFGAPFVAPVTGGGTRFTGLRCDSATTPGTVVALEATSLDGVTWGTYDRLVSRSGSTTLLLGEPAVSILAGTDPLLAAYGQATCNGEVYLDESRPTV